jgi:hypothetical protein
LRAQVLLQVFSLATGPPYTVMECFHTANERRPRPLSPANARRESPRAADMARGKLGRPRRAAGVVPTYLSLPHASSVGLQRHQRTSRGRKAAPHEFQDPLMKKCGNGDKVGNFIAFCQTALHFPTEACLVVYWWTGIQPPLVTCLSGFLGRVLGVV